MCTFCDKNEIFPPFRLIWWLWSCLCVFYTFQSKLNFYKTLVFLYIFLLKKYNFCSTDEQNRSFFQLMVQRRTSSMTNNNNNNGNSDIDMESLEEMLRKVYISHKQLRILPSWFLFVIADLILTVFYFSLQVTTSLMVYPVVSTVPYRRVRWVKTLKYPPRYDCQGFVCRKTLVRSPRWGKLLFGSGSPFT